MEQKDEINIKKLEAEKNKNLLRAEDVLVITNLIQFLAVYLIVSFNFESIPRIASILLYIFSMISFIGSCFYAIKIETEEGYYECEKCKYRYIPTYKKALFAPHNGKNRYMECPECHQKSWQKKVLTK